ncbi:MULTISPECIES: ATP-binding cassette domain-containing protein [Sulfurimonas]|uniref:ATP-binding cassette domain-containing protein n=1 Tax=Sulfurimonas TaxID=202746 RepID=UPI00165FF086|nr:ATP-binding cassette domain-containing protein [Sulfurimonas indica]
MITIKKLQISLDDAKLVDIAFTIQSSLALIGQSGSGKSLTLKALLGMLPKSMNSTLEYDSDFSFVAGESIGFVPQNPFTALSPLTKIKKQFFVDESRIEELFNEVGLSLELLERFPPELSGGQLQRVVIAMALEKRPKLLLLDEPTTALDPDTKIKILELLRNLQQKEGFTMLFVTHDMLSAKELCEEVCVIKDGLLVERGSMQEVITSPKEAYTKVLIEANFANRNFRE